MSLLFPGFLIAAGVVAAAVVALHFLVTSEPRTDIFPTVRFLPQAKARSTVVAIKFTDIPLLMLRVTAILLIGIALSQPHIAVTMKKVARIVMVDTSRAVERDAAWKDMVREHVAGADAIVAFSDTAHEIEPEALKGVLHAPSVARGSLSAAMIAAMRAAARARESADAIELVLLSPLLQEEKDAATPSLRALWPGGIKVVQVKAARPAPAEDALSPPRPLIEWAEIGSQFWEKRSQIQTVGGIRAGDSTLIFPFERSLQLRTLGGSPRVIARWIDGEPAAVEIAMDGGCLRSIGFKLPEAGDTILRTDFVRFLDRLSLPCGEVPDLSPVGVAFVSQLAGDGQPAMSSSVSPPTRRATQLSLWLLCAAALLLLVEYPLRRWSASRRGGA